MEEISVVIPVYNVQDFLKDCVDSVLSQSFTDIKVILVDDGSKDSSGWLCDEYSKGDPRITVIHKENGGLSSARNAGIEWTIRNSDCKWICFIDSDDWVHKDYLKLLYNAAVQNNAQVSVCYYSDVSVRKKVDTIENDPVMEMWTAEDAYTLRSNGPVAYAWNKLYSIDCFKDIRFPEGKYWEDLYITHKIVLPLKQVPVVKVPLYYYYHNPDGIVRSKWSDRHLDYYESNCLLMDYVKKNSTKEFYRQMLNNYVFALCTVYKKTKKNGARTQKGIPHIAIIRDYAAKALFIHFRDLSINEKKDLLKIII